MSTTTAPPKYPEHEKLRAVRDKSQAVGSFVDWLRDERGLTLASRHRHTPCCFDVMTRREAARQWRTFARPGEGDTLVPVKACEIASGSLREVRFDIRTELAAFFEIDADELENEKRTMLDELAAQA